MRGEERHYHSPPLTERQFTHCCTATYTVHIHVYTTTHRSMQFSRLGTLCPTLICFIRWGLLGFLFPPFYSFLLLVCYHFHVHWTCTFTCVHIHFVYISCRADPFFEGLVPAATAEPVLLSQMSFLKTMRGNTVYCIAPQSNYHVQCTHSYCMNLEYYYVHTVHYYSSELLATPTLEMVQSQFYVPPEQTKECSRCVILMPTHIQTVIHVPYMYTY